MTLGTHISEKAIHLASDAGLPTSRVPAQVSIVTVREEVIAQHRVMDEALQDDREEAGGAKIVDTPRYP